MRTLGAARAVLGMLALAGCADFTNAPDPTFGLPDTVVAAPTLDRDIQPIFTKRCSIGGCHSLATRQGGLALTPGVTWAALVNQPSRFGAGARLVVPFRSDNSWLMAMLAADPAKRSGLARMPLASSPLTPNQLRTIANWISRGAPDD